MLLRQNLVNSFAMELKFEVYDLINMTFKTAYLVLCISPEGFFLGQGNWSLRKAFDRDFILYYRVEIDVKSKS